MAPRIPTIIEEMRDYFQGEPIEDPEDNDEYLDRLGVADEPSESGIQPPLYATRTAENILNEFRDTPRRGPDMFQREYMSYFDRDIEAVTAAHDRNYTSAIDHTRMNREREDYMVWSNGDHEPRARRRMPHRSRFEDNANARRAREHTTEFVHEQVERQKVRMLQVILRDTEHLVYEFLERYERDMPANSRLAEDILLSMVDHFLEDLGNDIMLRHRVTIRPDHASFSTWLHIEVELPNMAPMRVSIDLQMWRDRIRANF